MEQSANEDNRKDDCGDKEKANDEATTSKADFNDPSQTAYNVNDLKTLEFNSADEVRQTMKALLKDKNLQECEDIENCSLKKPEDAKTDMKKDGPQEKIDSGRVIVSVGDINKDREALKTRKLQNRKRPGRPPKAGPSKKHKKNTTDIFYNGKLSQLMFNKTKKRKNRYVCSSDDSIFSL